MAQVELVDKFHRNYLVRPVKSRLPLLVTATIMTQNYWSRSNDFPPENLFIALFNNPVHSVEPLLPGFEPHGD